MSYLISPDVGTATPITSVDQVYAMALQYGRIAIGGANIRERYAEFNKDNLQYGAIVADYKIKAVTSTEMNPNNSTFGNAKYPEVLKLFFGDFKNRTYEVEVNDGEAMAVVNRETPLEVFVAQVINAINEGERLESNENYEKMFFSTYFGNEETDVSDDSLITVNMGEEFSMSAVNGILTDLSQHEYFENPTDEQVFTEIRDVVKDMTANDTGANSGGFVSSARLEDIRIIVPYKWLNSAGVTFLSRVFNMTETDMLAKIVETPSLTTQVSDSDGSYNFYGIIICHKNALGRVIRYRSDMTDFVRQRWSRWFGRNVIDMYYFNKYEKAWGITFTRPL